MKGKVMKYIYLFLMLLACYGCAPEKTMYQDRVLAQMNTEDLSKIIWDFTIEAEHTKRLRLSNSYVAAADNNTFIRFQFTSQALLEVGPARQLLVDLVEGFLEKLNKAPVAKELMPYPFDAYHLEIYVYFESFHGVYVDPFYIGWIALERGTSYFYAFDLQNRELDYWHSRIEPYEKSRSFVQFEREAERRYESEHPKGGSQFMRERFGGPPHVPGLGPEGGRPGYGPGYGPGYPEQGGYEYLGPGYLGRGPRSPYDRGPPYDRSGPPGDRGLPPDRRGPPPPQQSPQPMIPEPGEGGGQPQRTLRAV